MKAYHAELCRDQDGGRDRDDDPDDEGGADARPVKITSLAQLRELEDAARARA